jgi:hypothetical protein
MDKLFVDRYIDYINKTPLMRDLEKDVFEYITMYNKIQQMHALYFKNLKIVNDALVQSLDNYKDDIRSLKKAHGRLVDDIQSELLSYYKSTHEMTSVLRTIYGTMTKLSKLKFRFLEQNVLNTKDKIEIMYHLINNPDYKKLVTEFLMALKRFDKLQFDRTLKCNNVLLLIEAVKVCQEDLVGNYDVNQYDLMVNVSNQKFVGDIQAQLVFQERLMGDLISMENVLKTKLLPKLAESISEFKKDHRVDPTFAIEELSDGSFRQTFQRYLKLSKAIETTMKSLGNEVRDISMRDALVAKQPLQALNISNSRGWVLKHPKVVKMVAERDALSDLMNRRRTDIVLKDNELNFAIKENGVALVQFGGGKRSKSKSPSRKGKKHATNAAKNLIKGYLNYAEIQQQLSFNKAKYAKVLTQLYGVRDALNKNEYIAALDGAVNELQSEVDRARLTKIMAATKEADYQDYIRQLTADNPTLAKLAKHNNYAGFLVKKGKNSGNEYMEELDDSNMENYRKQTQQIMTSSQNEDILKKSVKTMIKNAFNTRQRQSVFDLASNDSRHLVESRPIMFGGVGETEPIKLNPMIFNPFSLVSDESQCLRVIKSAHDEMVNELKTQIRLRYHGVELKRAEAKVDIIADRIVELLKKDRCSPAFMSTMLANMSDSYIRLLCTLRCQHIDALESANWKAGMIEKQTNEVLSVLVKRMMEVECPRLCKLGVEITGLAKSDENVKAKYVDCLQKCLYSKLEGSYLKKDTDGKYVISKDLLATLAKGNIEIRDIPLITYDPKKLEHLVPLIQTIEVILKKVVWSHRDMSDRAQHYAVDSALRRKNINKHCLHIHESAKKIIANSTANYLDTAGEMFAESKGSREAQTKFAALLNEAAKTLIDKKDVVQLILNVHNDTNSELHKLMANNLPDKDHPDRMDKTYVRLYENDAEKVPLYNLLDVSDHEKLNELFEAIKKQLNMKFSDTAAAKELEELEELVKPKEGFAGGEPIPTILWKLYQGLSKSEWMGVYNAYAMQTQSALNNFDSQVPKTGEIEVNEDVTTMFKKFNVLASEDHKKCAENTTKLSEQVKESSGLAQEFLQTFQILNATVWCLVNAVVPKENQVSCARATVGNSMEIDSLVELGRRLNAINDETELTQKMLSANQIKNQLNGLQKLWIAESKIQTIFQNDIKEYLGAQAKHKYLRKQFEVSGKNDLLKLLEEGKHLDVISNLMEAQREKADIEEKLKAKIHNLEKKTNMYHKAITGSFNRYNKIVRKTTDHGKLLGEIMKFIELWNKCHADKCDGAKDPIGLLFSRIGTEHTNSSDGVPGGNIILDVSKQIKKYTDANIDESLKIMTEGFSSLHKLMKTHKVYYKDAVKDAVKEVKAVKEKKNSLNKGDEGDEGIKSDSRSQWGPEVKFPILDRSDDKDKGIKSDSRSQWGPELSWSRNKEFDVEGLQGGARKRRTRVVKRKRAAKRK